MSYGTLVIMDGSPVRNERPAEPYNRFVRLGPGPDGAIYPRPPDRTTGITTFFVELNYSDRAYLYGGIRNSYIAEIPVGYKKAINRLAPGGNPLSSATNFIAQFAGCSEAKKVRGRAIALSRIHGTISGETFRFPLEAP